ncbi:uncharacterized protein LOC132559908 [Ylistrum balloti]|uniref:uncharacterized protein LOC132559908 n=1 Tax=Ylistrum balloti TaxID=509963 RepID=UPI002905DCFB|nr:uncharacterized protein LOC132559908 [Ylistrum balloti]XP_060080637.1 uncharacterized protein LOC132559908 [Ylistrum balloti]
MAANTDKWLTDILQEYSTQKYFIEYNGFMSNHMAHGIVALKDLGASQKKIAEFAIWCGQDLESPDHPDHTDENPNVLPVSEESLQELRGKRISFYGIRNAYIDKLKVHGSLEDIIKAEFPKLIRGLGCVAFHGLIQLGYGFHVKHGTVVCEGLAYLHHSCAVLTIDDRKTENNIANFGTGDMAILDLLQEMRADTSLRQNMLDGALVIKKTGRFLGSGFSNRFSALTENCGDVLLKYANRLRIPQATSSSKDAEFLLRLSDWLIDQAIVVYAISERPNDFFLLHGVTSSWSLRQIIPCLNPVDAMDALRTFTCCLLATYLTVDAPALIPTTVAATVNENTWREIIDTLLARDLDSHEEHLLKLVQVCYLQWKVYKCSSNAGLYVEAAKACMNHKLAFCRYREDVMLD